MPLEQEDQLRFSMRWVWRLALTLLVIGLVITAFLLLSPKPLVVKGALKTEKGPVAAGTYDFRLKFYNATTRTDLVYSYDASDVVVDDRGNFDVKLPAGNDLAIATLMQVCIASKGDAVPGTVIGGGDVTLPSCEVADQSSPVAFNQTICGLTAVEQNPTHLVNWLASRSIIYATPTKACGQSAESVGTISGDDVVTPLLNSPGSLADLLGGVDLQLGTLLTVGDEGQIVTTPPEQAVGEFVHQEIENSQNQEPSSEQTVINETTNVFNSYPTTITGEPNTDSQTLSLSGNVLSISGGNSVTLPSGGGGAEQDGAVGNEILDVTGSGLVRVGAGTTLDPFRIGLITCANGQLLKSTGPGAWSCAADTDTNTTYSPGTGISFSGTTINNTGVLSFALPAGSGLANTGSGQNVALRLKDCGNGEILQFNAGVWDCVVPGGVSSYSFSITDTTTTEPILNGDTVTFIGNEGLVATVTAGDTVTYGIIDGGVTTIKLDDGSVIESKIADGAVTTIKLDDGAVTNDKLASSSLTVAAGSGLAGGGVVALGSSTTLNLQPCANGQILKHNGTTWACAADSGDTNTDNQTLSIVANAPNGANTVSYDLSISGGNTVNFDDRDTLYISVTGGGLALNGTAFSLQTCPVGQLLKSTNAVSPTYACAADTDTNTTYSAGTGLSLVGTIFNNTGVLGVTASGALTSSGGQNPNIAFANGSAAGQFWQWDGDSWELATLAAEQDPVIGNEVVGVTGVASGLTRSGSGTSVSPYTLAANVGNGIQIAANAIAINSPTCSGTDKLQWTGTAFACAADTDTNTTYVAGNGLQLAGTTFSVNSPTCAGTTKLQWNGTAFVCSADVDTNTDTQTLTWVDGTRTLSISNGNSVVIPDANTTYSPLTNGGLRLVGTQFALQTCTSGQILKAQATSGEWACAADTDTNTTYGAGTGLSLVGNTFNNTGTLDVTASGALISSGGQNPNIAFANGSVTGQFWQWDGDSWELATLAAEQDPIVGNEVTNVTGAASGLTRSGSGTAVDPYTLTANVGNGIQITSNAIAINSPTCSGTDKLQWTGTAFTCSADADTNTTYSAGTGLSLVGTTFSNTGTLSVTASGALTSSGGQNPNIAFANGSVTGQFWQWDGDSWELATLAAEQDPIIGNEVTGVTGVNSGLTRSGAGTAVDPYTLAVSVGNGIQLAGNTVAINSPTCSGTDKLQWTGTAFICAADVDTNTTYAAGNGLQLAGTTFSVNSPTCAGTTKLQWNGTAFVCSADVDTDTTYTALASGGLRLSGTSFALAICASGQILKAQATSGEWACAADTDTNTTYTAGTGLSLVGTTFNNTGVLTVTGSGALTSSGGQNPNIAFANGSAVGQFWQWDGDSWELASLPANGDGVIGNEVTNVTGSNSGLTRSGTGTAVDPYTLAVSVGSGLQLASGSVAINSPTCAGTTKLQWNGTAFVCSADIDTDTTNFSITDGTTTQSVAATQAITFSGDANDKTTVTLSGTRQLTFGLDTTGALSGQVLTYSGTSLAWQSPTTYAPTTCAVGGTYFCQGGNTFGATAVLGTNDAQSLTFETSNTVQMTILANGNVGIGTSPTEKLDVNGNINIPATSSTVGVIKQGGIRLIHTKDDGSDSSLFAGLNSGNLTTTGFDNVGVGSNALAALTDGFYNTAVGSGALTANTDGIYNTAVGFSSMEANTSGYYNSALGERTLISNIDGFNNTAAGGDALSDNTSGTDNTGLGVGALSRNTTGDFNVGIGSGAGTTSILNAESTTGNNNVFIGHDSGLSTSTQRNNSTAVGAFSVVDQSDSLVLGCISGTNGCTARTRIGVGTATPQNMLHIDGGAGAVTTMAQFTNSTTGQAVGDGFILGIDQNGTSFLQQREVGAMVFYTNGGLRLFLDSSGRLGISQNSPGYLLHVGSSATTAGTSVARFESASGTCTVTPVTGMACTSDERSKKNISNYGGALDIVNQIEVKEYNMKTDPDDATKQIGVIAQQVEGLLPSLVTTDKDGKKSFSYAGLTPVLLQAIKEQQIQIDTIQKGMWTGGVVTDDTTFKTAATFEGPVRFSQKATFEDDVEILGKIRLSGDQVNSIVIPEGSRRTKVWFKGGYPNSPYITASPREFIKGEYRITEAKKTSFVIELSSSQSKAIRFDWHAFSR